MFAKCFPPDKDGNVKMYYGKSRQIPIGYTYGDNGRRKKIYKSKTDIIEVIGYVHEFKDQYDDPLKHFKQEAKRLTKEMKLKQESETMQLTIDLNEEMNESTNDLYNLGTIPLTAIYYKLRLNVFLNNRKRGSKTKYNLEKLFRFLLFNRILNPSSIRQTLLQQDQFLQDFNYNKDDPYRALPFYANLKEDLIAHLNKEITKSYNRDPTLLYYDVTNYYFAIDKPKGKQQLGVSKEKRRKPIIQLGLIMDDNGLPVTYDTFSGNTPDCITFPSMLETSSFDLNLSNVVYVADKGMMTGTNIKTLILRKCGYVISSSVRKSSEKVKRYVLKKDGYINIPGTPDGDFKYKSRVYPADITIKTDSGKKRKITVPQRQIIFYSKKYDRRAKFQRQEAVQKAWKIACGNGECELDFGARKYIKKEYIDPKTGDVIDKSWVDNYIFDEKKLADEEKYDGYYIICSNVEGIKEGEEPFKEKARWIDDGFLKLNKPVSDLDIIGMYRGLWKIEETFKVTKSDLKTRPCFISSEIGLDGHFLLCFVSLVISRVLQLELNNEYSVAAIIEELKHYNFDKINEIYKGTYYSEIIRKVGDLLGLNLAKKNLTAGDLKKIFGTAKKF